MIKLYYNNAYKWFSSNGVYTIGFAFFENKLYKDDKLNELVQKNNINTIITKLNGCFSIVIQSHNKTILCSDNLRCFPVFYKKNGDVTDDISLFKNKINEIALEEMKQSHSTTGNKTIYEDVFQVEAGEIVTIHNSKITKRKHFKYTLSEEECSFEELDSILNRVFKRTITYLNGRTAVIPLSGGQDSRLLAYYLKKNKYPNIIAFTYGNKNGGEVEISKKVAEFLDIPWYFIEYTEKNCQEIYYNKKEQKNIFDYYGRGVSIPLIQELTAISELLKTGVIDKSCVVLPGYTLDFLSGNHVWSEFVENEQVEKSLIRDLIYRHNYNLTKKNNDRFDNVISEAMNINFNDKKISALKGQEIYDYYDFCERQAKYVNNGIRNFDYFGLYWYLPFWDRELINFFAKVPLKDKYKRSFFIEFVNFKYKDLMEYAKTYKSKTFSFKGKFKLLKKIKHIFYYYHNHSLNFYYYFKFHVYLKYVLSSKNFNYDYYIGEDYERQIRKELKK